MSSTEAETCAGARKLGSYGVARNGPQLDTV